MLEVKDHLTTLLEELEWEKLKHSSVQALIIQRKNFTHETNVTSAKSSVCVVLVLFIVQSC